jgi:hypothetical protein
MQLPRYEVQIVNSVNRYRKHTNTVCVCVWRSKISFSGTVGGWYHWALEDAITVDKCLCLQRKLMTNIRTKRQTQQ